MARNNLAGYYDDMYVKRDFIHFKQDRIYTQIICSFLPEPHNATVLDVGCGRGYWSKLLTECGVGHVVGIDISAVGLDIARKQVPAGEFVLADASHLNFAPGTFDMVFCQGLSLYNTGELSSTRELGLSLLSCLKANGLFVFAGASNLSGKTRHGWMQHKPKNIQKYLVSLGCDIESTYLVERAIFLRILGRYILSSAISRYILPPICYITKLPVTLVCIARKKA